MSREAYKFCFCFQRIFKLTMAEPPEDIKNLFDKYSENELMTVENLQNFLVENQQKNHEVANFLVDIREKDASDHEDAVILVEIQEGKDPSDHEDAQRIFDGLKELHVIPKTSTSLDLGGFFRYLFGDLNPPLRRQVHHDMTAPLAHYFIYTGHNSYLQGNQICSASGTRPIIDALRRGVRVIELDLWPNCINNDVQVRHGGTLTSSVKLIKCLEAIEKNVRTSDYPVIITFEDHLDSSLRLKVAQMVETTFGEKLYPSVEFWKKFPSLESLKGKILISTKPPKKSKSPEKFKDSDVGSKTMNELDRQTTPDDEMDEEAEKTEAVEEDSKYENLIAIHAIKAKGRLEEVLKTNIPSRLSLSEKKLNNVVKALGTDIVRFTQTNLLRVYPRGRRIDSSNYNPLTAWSHGAQMVAFNMQGHDEHLWGHNEYLWVMQGMFRANGGCGYVKKPDILLEVDKHNEVFNPTSPRKPKKLLKVKVYMGDGWHLEFRKTHFDLCSPPDFFIKLKIYGVKDDEKSETTKELQNQWVPVWNEEFEFPLRVPELALLGIEVREGDFSKNDFGGQTCLLVSQLRRGIRAVPLYDKKGKQYQHVKLLMKFQLIKLEP